MEWKFLLEILGQVANIFTAIAACFAVWTYFFQRKRDKTLLAVDQVSFFREKIFKAEVDLVDEIRAKVPTYLFPAIYVKEWTIESVKKSSNASAISAQLSVLNVGRTIALRKILLDLMEEIALRIKYTEISNHKALGTIYAAFVSIVEQNAVSIISQKEIVSQENTYAMQIELYDLWKDSIDRTPPDEKMKAVKARLKI